jgi:hypothetical protein
MSPRRNWDSPTPSLASECAPPPGTKGGGGVEPSRAGEGLGEAQFQRLEKKLSTLPTLWILHISGRPHSPFVHASHPPPASMPMCSI